MLTDKVIARSLSGIAFTSGTAVLTGWAFNGPELRCLYFTWPPVKPNTAIALMAGAIAVWLLTFQPYSRRPLFHLARVFAALMVAIGAVTLLEYTFESAPGIDTWIFPNAVLSYDATSPGRMAGTTAASLMLLGLSMIMLTLKHIRLSQSFALLAFSLAAIALLATLYQISIRDYWSAYRPTAMGTSLCVGLLSFSILLLEAKHGFMSSLTNPTAGATMARRLLLVALLVPLMIGWMALWGQQQQYYGPGFGVVLSTALCMLTLSVMIWWNATMLYRSEVARLRTHDDVERLLQEAHDREGKLRDKQRQLVQAAKLASIGELATGVAHELNNPLNNIGLVVGNELDRIRLGLTDTVRIEQELYFIQEQVKRAASIVNQLRTFGRSARNERGPLALKEVLTSSLDLVGRQLALQNISIVMNLGEGNPYVEGDRLQLQQVFLNLITNARDALATARQKEIVLSTRVTPPFVMITVRDSGTGMTPDVQERVFDPFFTTKGVGEGTGLGLSIAHGIIQSHGGTITVESLLGTGTVFTVTLPILPTSSEGELFLTDPNASHDKACTTGRSSQDLFNDASMHVGCSKSSFDDMALE